MSLVEAGLGAQPAAAASADLKVVRLTYYYRDPLALALDIRSKAKFITFDFANDRLVAYNFRSTYRDDTSNFDEKKASLLESGKTTRDGVVALFGPPTGRAVFPAAPAGTEIYTYDFSVTGTMRSIEKRLDVAIGDDGLVQKFNLVQETTPISRGATTVPVFIPRGK